MTPQEWKNFVAKAEKQMWIDYEQGKIKSVDTEYIFNHAVQFVMDNLHHVPQVSDSISEIENSCRKINEAKTLFQRFQDSHYAQTIDLENEKIRKALSNLRGRA